MASTLSKWFKYFVLAMACYPLVLVAVWVLQAFIYPYPLLRGLSALLPVVPVVFAMVYFSRAVGEMDELQRRIQLEAMAFSLGGIVLTGMTVGMLTSFGIDLTLNMPFWWASLLNGFFGADNSPSWVWVSVLAVFLWGIGQFFALRRYR